MSLQEQIRGSRLLGGIYAPMPSNSPEEYASRQPEYYGFQTARQVREMLKYASDVSEAKIEVYNSDGTTTVYTDRIRMANVVRPSAAIGRDFDDFKIILCENPALDYLQPGTKVTAMGSVWLAVNPNNISSVDGNGIVWRCNTVWNHLDWYGNVLSEPIHAELFRASNNTPDAEDSMMIAKGCFNVVAQRNRWTEQIDNNTRFVLGSKTYIVTGYSDFHQEFTGDYDSVRLLKFTVRQEEHNDESDDMENHVAGGKNFSAKIAVSSGSGKLWIGAQKKLVCIFERNGNAQTATDEHPITFRFSSSDETILTVDQDGTVTGVSEGSAAVTVTLEQNPNVTASVKIIVDDADAGTGIFFTGSAPERLQAFESCTIEATAFNDGADTGTPILYRFSGAAAGSYSAVQTGNRVKITCYGFSETPLTVTASADGYGSQEITIKLEGM